MFMCIILKKKNTVMVMMIDDDDDDDDDEHLALFIFTLRYFRLSFLASKFTEFHVACSYILYNSNKNR